MLLLLSLIIAWAGCNPDTAVPSYPKPDDLIPEDTYIDLLIEMQLAKTVFNSDDGLSDPDSVVQAIYDKYGVTEEGYEDSHRWYQSNYKEQQDRIEIAKDRLLKERARIETPPDSSQSAES